MSQPLDFSSGARKPTPPQTDRGRPALPGPDGPAGKKRLLTILVLLGLLVGGGYAAIVVFDVFGSGKQVPARDARYCVLVGQLDQLSLITGAASSIGAYDGPPAKIKAAVDGMGSSLPQLRSLAPTAIRHDQGVIVDALKKAAAGDSTRLRAPDFVQAASRVRDFTASHCSAGSGGD